jgi:hypothetical protein
MQVLQVDPIVAGHKFGDCPLLVVRRETEEHDKYIQMSKFIHCIQRISPISYHPGEEFPVDGCEVLRRLSTMRTQACLHEQLNERGHDFSKMPFKLQAWDYNLKQWCLLTIDYQIKAACYLVFLGKNPESIFTDEEQDKPLLYFKTKKMFTEITSQMGFADRVLDYIEVTPMLHIKTPDQGMKTEYLLLTFNEREINFPGLRFVLPAILVNECPANFSCFCLQEEITTTFKTGCGHCYHYHCMNEWLSRNRSCPSCRRTVGHLYYGL